MYEADKADEGSSVDGVVVSVDVGTTIGPGLWPRSIDARLPETCNCSELAIADAERFVLDRLMGREKLSEGRWRRPPLFEASELWDGDRGRPRGIGAAVVDMGECGPDIALLEDSFRGGWEKVDPPLELL